MGYVLEGSIRWERTPSHGNRVRVTPQLIRVLDDTHLWASVYDTTLADIFAVQSAIAGKVSDALDVTLGDPERQALGAQPTKNLDAYGFYLRGLDHLTRSYTEQDMRAAVAQFEQAVRVDPNFALAYARLASAHDNLYWFLESTAERLASVKRAADRALELDPNLPEGHLALGFYYYHGHLDYDHALEQFTLAERRQPNNSEMAAAIGFVQRRQGKWEEALASLRKAADLDPRSNENMENLGETFLALGRLPEAEQYFDRAQSLTPDWAFIYVYRGWLALAGSGDVDRARRVLAEGATHVAVVDLLVEVSRLGLAGPPFVRLLDDSYREQLVALGPQAFGSDSAGYYLARATALSTFHQAREARANFDSVRVILEPKNRKKPDDPFTHAILGIAYAGLGRKNEAIREGRQALSLRPISLDRYSGPSFVARLAEIYVMVGEYDAAIDQLAIVVSVPGDLKVTAPLLRIDPIWAPLRGNPRFERLLSGK